MRKNFIYASAALLMLAFTGAASAEGQKASEHKQTPESRSGVTTESSGNAHKTLSPSDEVGDHSSAYDSKHGYDSDDAH
ncbi:hypothetical protein [Methylocella silvestris]|uniref:Uncharacterized protein n=1 Tax=Methylocella silvestris TaxID=199596 RepID=A0A2J7TJZ1_METSI|nr:hypothetical protein [Methylocella silvestris]PNG27089.1 hypothetical protein CR492_05205 [Methylocella silvestris]